jgi:acetyl-CoA carboxylase carboxyl transferase subunit alpha
MSTYLDFEKPIAELETKVAELKKLAEATPGMNVADEVSKLEARGSQLLKDTYAKLTAWQKTQVARHGDRPHFVDYARGFIDEFTPLAGDRGFGDDSAIVTGLGRFRGRPVAVIGHEKGNDTKSRLKHNFGMATPEGYRKAIRIMDMADRFGLPVISLVDTPGAYPGLVSEERGVAEAIARSTDRCLSLTVPMTAVIIGEGGSGGAVAIASADTVLMLENSVYSVITPEGCASILWRSAEKAADAANAMKVTAQDLLALKVIDRIIPEPLGGAHRDPAATVKAVGDAIADALEAQSGKDGETLKRERRAKFLRIGRSLAA